MNLSLDFEWNFKMHKNMLDLSNFGYVDSQVYRDTKPYWMQVLNKHCVYS